MSGRRESNATNLSCLKSRGLEFASSARKTENQLFPVQIESFRLSPLGIAMDTTF